MRFRLVLLSVGLSIAVAVTLASGFFWWTSRYYFLWWYPKGEYFFDIANGALLANHLPKENYYGVRGSGLNVEWQHPITTWQFEGSISERTWWEVTIPLWSLTGLFFLASIVVWWRLRRLLNRVEAGCCLKCGYLTAGLLSSRCPECGGENQLPQTSRDSIASLRRRVRATLKWSLSFGALAGLILWIASAFFSAGYHLQQPYDQWTLAWTHIEIHSGAIDYAYGYGKTPDVSNGWSARVERVRPFRWWFEWFNYNLNQKWPKRSPDVIPLWIFGLGFAVPAAVLWRTDRRRSLEP